MRKGQGQQDVFDKQKEQVLSSVEDLSRKGSVDALIVDFLSELNASKDYFSLSSCSGRIVVVRSQDKVKKGCQWLMVSHDPVQTDPLWDAITQTSNEPGTTTLKFEPFILHVQCRNQEAAKTLHTLSLDCGYRNSGLTLGKSGKIVLAVRSTHGLEIPLTDNDGRVLVTREYVDCIGNVANKKLADNEVKFRQFEERCRSKLF